MLVIVLIILIFFVLYCCWYLSVSTIIVDYSFFKMLELCWCLSVSTIIIDDSLISVEFLLIFISFLKKKYLFRREEDVLMDDYSGLNKSWNVSMENLIFDEKTGG